MVVVVVVVSIKEGWLLDRERPSDLDGMNRVGKRRVDTIFIFKI
jgi:hypothetical protein